MVVNAEIINGLVITADEFTATPFIQVDVYKKGKFKAAIFYSIRANRITGLSLDYPEYEDVEVVKLILENKEKITEWLKEISNNE